MGSIWGGSAFNFGVFSRKDTDKKISDSKLSYSGTHGWYSSLGVSAEAAFALVRAQAAQVASLAAQGDLDGIEKLAHLGEAYKWKLAFHYQNRQAPVIVDIFKKAPLAVFVGDAAAPDMAVLQKAAVAKRPAELGVLEFGRLIWEAWSVKNLAIWKLSHGDQQFTISERQQLCTKPAAPGSFPSAYLMASSQALRAETNTRVSGAWRIKRVGAPSFSGATSNQSSAWASSNTSVMTKDLTPHRKALRWHAR